MKTALFLACAAAGASVLAADNAKFKAQTIDDKVGIGYGLAIADVNGDKKLDVLLVDKGEVAWYENPSWNKHVIAENLTKLDHVCIAAQDIDGDGKAEIAVGAGWNPGDTVNSGAVFYLEPPSDRSGKWNPVQLPHEPTVHRMWWVKGDGGNYRLVVAPLHGRGNKNAQGDGVKLLEYTKPAAPGGEWKTRVIDDSMHATHNFDPVQWDNDPGQELLFCGREGVLLLDRNGGSWTKTQLISSEKNPGFSGAGEVRLGQGEKERFIATIELMHGTNVVVYSPKEGGWERKVIDNTLSDGHAIACGDMLHEQPGKGQQIVAGWRGKNAEGKVGIKLYSKRANGEWKGEWVDDNGMACEDLKVADLNGDGWLDIIAAGRATKNLKVYWNQGGGQ